MSRIWGRSTVQRDPGRMYPPPALGRGDLVWRYTIAWIWYVVAACGALLTLVLAGPTARNPTLGNLAWVVIDPILGLIMAIAIRWRRRYPFWIAVAFPVMGAFSFSGFCFMAWALVSLSTRRKLKPVITTVITTLISMTGSFLISFSRQLGAAGGQERDGVPLWLSLLIVFVVQITWMVLAIVLGYYVGARRDLIASLEERAQTTEREQFLRIEQSKAEERARIAREMHDVVAHRISLVSMHAGVLVYRTDLTPEQTHEIAQTIQENSHAALVELRGVLSDLRAGGQPPTPQPTLADLPALLEQARSLNATVSLRNRLADTAQLPTAIARHSYRIIQESLTNARKHAENAPIYITLSGKPGIGIDIEIRNPLATSTQVPGAGMGLIGLQERAELAGGSLSFGRQNGDFVVKAWLPWQN